MRRAHESPDSSQTQIGVRPGEFICDGVRLEVRPLRWSCQAPHGKTNSSDTLGTTTYLEPPDDDKVGATAAEKNVSTIRHESGGNGAGAPPRDNDGRAISVGEHGHHHRGAAEDGVDHVVKDLVPGVSPSLPVARKGPAHNLDHDPSATLTDGRRHHCCTLAVFAQCLTHSEVDALLGPNLVWQNPFEVQYQRIHCPMIWSATGRDIQTVPVVLAMLVCYEK